MASKELPGAIIIGGAFPSLGAARNLARHGIPVYIVDSEICVAQFSRMIQSFFKCPGTKNDSDLVDFLLNLAHKEKLSGCVLFPSNDESIRILAQYKNVLCKYFLVTTPVWETVQYFYDKRLTNHLAKETGVAVPETYVVKNPAELDQLGLDFPIVLKPAITSHFMPVTKKKAYRANNMAELAELFKLISAIIDPSEVVIQEFIPGGGERLYSYGGFFKDGEAIAGLSARRLRQHPMEFGRASTYVETVDIPELKTLATQFLKGKAYTGLAEVEFMFDEKHGRFELLEVNPRFWGWHSIAIRAGLDLPYFAYADAIGEPFTPGQVKSGVKWVRLATDIPTVAVEIWKGRLTIRHYLETMAGNIEIETFSLRDPFPFFADFLLIPYYMKTRGF